MQKDAWNFILRKVGLKQSEKQAQCSSVTNFFSRFFFSSEIPKPIKSHTHYLLACCGCYGYRPFGVVAHIELNYFRRQAGKKKKDRAQRLLGTQVQLSFSCIVIFIFIFFREEMTCISFRVLLGCLRASRWSSEVQEQRKVKLWWMMNLGWVWSCLVFSKTHPEGNWIFYLHYKRSDQLPLPLFVFSSQTESGRNKN